MTRLGGIKACNHDKKRARAMKRFILFLFILFCLVGCGFHLRGQMNFPPSLHRIYLQSKDPYGQLSKNIKLYLRMSGIYVADNPKDATTILDILNESQNQVLQNVSGTMSTRQYNLVLTVVFQVTDKYGAILMPPQSVSETRPITILANQILGGSNEQAVLFQQMRQAIVYTIMTRLASHDVKQMLESSIDPRGKRENHPTTIIHTSH